MFKKFHSNESGQTALETAIILIAFVVVASVFAFAILSAGTASTDRGEAAIYAGLEGVQSSMSVRGAVTAHSAAGKVDQVQFTLTLANGADPVDLTHAAADRSVLIGYRTAAGRNNNLDWVYETVANGSVGDGDAMLEEGELALITVTIPAAANIAAATEFTLEVLTPTGAVLNINRRTPAALETYMELR